MSDLVGVVRVHWCETHNEHVRWETATNCAAHPFERCSIVPAFVTRGLVEVCPNCEGTGVDGSTYVPATHLTPSEVEPCGWCRGGVRIKPDVVEKAAKAVYSQYYGPSMSEPRPTAREYGIAEAALLAVLGGEE